MTERLMRWVRGWIPAGWRLRRRVRVPVVFDLAGVARTATLELRRSRGSARGLVPDPEMSVLQKPDFVRALDDAYSWAQARDGFPRHSRKPWTVVWALRDQDGSAARGEVDGGSLGAAFGVGLAALFGLSRPARRRLDPEAFISARLDVTGALDTVTSLHTKVPALGGRARRLMVAAADEAPAGNARQGDHPSITGGRRAVDAMVFAAAPRPRSVPVLAAVVLLFAGALIWVGIERSDAHDARIAQLAQRMLTTSQQKLATDPAAAALAGAAAVKLAPQSPAARAALIRATTVDTRYAGVLAEGASSVALSPDGTLLATGGDNHSVTLVRTDRSLPPRTARAGGNRTSALAFSRDGRYLFTGDERGKLVRWDTRTLVAAPLSQLDFYGDGAATQMTVSPDGALLAVLTARQTINVYETAAGTVVSSSSAVPTATSLVFTDPQTLVVGVIGRAVTDQILAYRARRVHEKPKVVSHVGKRPLTQGVTALAVSGDGKTLVSGDIRGQVALWDVATLTQRKIFDAGPTVLALNPDLHAEAGLVTTAPGLGVSTVIDRSTTTAKTVMWDLVGGKATTAALDGPFHTATVVADAALRTAVVRTTGGDATLWTDLNGERMRQDGLVAEIVPDPLDPRAVLTVGSRGRIDVVSAAEGRVMHSVPPTDDSIVYGLGVSPSGLLLATGHPAGRIMVRDRTGRVLRRLAAGTKPVYRLAFSPDGRFLATGGGDGTVRLWDLSSGSLARAWSTNANVVQQILFDPTGYRLYAADSRFDGATIRGGFWWVSVTADAVHDVQDRLYPARAMVNLPGDRVLVGDDGGSVRPADDRLQPVPDKVPYQQNANVFVLAYSTSADMIVSGSGDGTATMLRPDDLTVVAQLHSLDPMPENKQGAEGIYSAAITGDGQYAVFGGHAGRIQVIPLADDLLVQRACRLAGRQATAKDLNLSEDDMREVTNPC